jgi:hypothetical protein
MKNTHTEIIAEYLHDLIINHDGKDIDTAIFGGEEWMVKMSAADNSAVTLSGGLGRVFKISVEEI